MPGRLRQLYCTGWPSKWKKLPGIASNASMGMVAKQRSRKESTKMKTAEMTRSWTGQVMFRCRAAPGEPPTCLYTVNIVHPFLIFDYMYDLADWELRTLEASWIVPATILKFPWTTIMRQFWNSSFCLAVPSMLAWG
jgi:hypothetical protein